MSTDTREIRIGEHLVIVVRRAIKNLHLGVYPPSGRIRVAAPLAMSDEAIRLAVIGKLGWIKRHKTGFVAQPRQSPRQMLGGESHYVWGRRYRLQVIPANVKARVEIAGRTRLELHIQPGTTTAHRAKVLGAFYRDELRAKASPLIDRWAKRLQVRPRAWGIKRMKTRWGTCNVEAGRVWLNLELAKKPVECLEYLIVHELMHLKERTHNERFVALMDQHLPSWRARRKQLNSEPLAHEDWSY